MKAIKYLSMAMLGIIGSGVFAAPTTNEMTALSDNELSAESGQGLVNSSFIAPNDASNLMKGKTIGGTAAGNVGFYKLGLEAELELNLNARNVQLGCGGINGAGACDIDIKNLALSGLPDSYDANGNPVFDNGRPSTSAKLTNPFMEFAIKDPEKASTREVLGFRASAEKISALLTAGLSNNATPNDDGIQSLSGFMRIAATTGEVKTKAANFGKRPNEQIQGLLNALGNDRTFTSQPTDPDTLGVDVPSLIAPFSMPAFQVNGNRNKEAVARGITTKINNIDLTTGTNQLKVTFPAILLIATNAKVQLKQGSAIKNLNMDITFNQSLSMIHNIPLTGNGGYLSLQSQKILWPGSYVDPADTAKTDLLAMTKTDVSQPGWWMSIAEPVQLGYLKSTKEVNISNVFPQVASLMTAELLKEENRINIPGGDAISTLFGTTITTPTPIVVDLDAATLSNPATLTLGNIQLKNQEVKANCYGGLTFC